jgi:tRNA (cytidine/uridine-2'-O-)-methyltransferase
MSSTAGSLDPLSRIVLIEPLIPENTGNISRTAVATASDLHLVRPLGFEITESRVRRAGLDYWDNLVWHEHNSWDHWLQEVQRSGQLSRVFMIETTGETPLYEADLRRGDWLVFGKETTGLPAALLAEVPREQRLTLPMPGPTRSLNLSNTVAIAVFELMRQVQARSPRSSS